MSSRETFHALSIFNPNEWRGNSRSIIEACSAQHGLLLHIKEGLKNAMQIGASVCQAAFEEFKIQWKSASWNVNVGCYLVEVPPVHLYIHGFLSTSKALLDLVVQLASSEGLVNKSVHGFHKKGKRIGGEFLDILSKKAAPGREKAASALSCYLLEQKSAWIDKLVNARDDMAHPERGMRQIMWELELVASGADIRCVRMVPPFLGGFCFDKYIANTANDIETACIRILSLMRAS